MDKFFLDSPAPRNVYIQVIKSDQFSQIFFELIKQKIKIL